MCKMDLMPDTAEEDLAQDFFFDDCENLLLHDDEEDEDPSCSSNEAYNSLGNEIKCDYSDGYYDMIDAYKNELHKIVDESHPGEWSYGMDMFVTYLNLMKDFYHGGEGVHAMEQKDEDPIRYKNEPTREETLTKALEYYYKWQHISDDNFKVIDLDDSEKIFDRNWKCEYRFRPDGKWYPSSRKIVKKWHKKMYKLEQKYKRKFLGIVSKYLESWWD